MISVILICLEFEKSPLEMARSFCLFTLTRDSRALHALFCFFYLVCIETIHFGGEFLRKNEFCCRKARKTGSNWAPIGGQPGCVATLRLRPVSIIPWLMRAFH
jgi:hypothetical protein